jgi:hypothetical protein
LGYRAERFRTETALNQLRELDAFRKLLAEIEALNNAEAAKKKN